MLIKVIAILLGFLGICAPANLVASSNNWVLAVGTENKSVYVDKDSIKRTGFIARYWTRTDYEPATERGWVRAVRLNETDCAGERIRFLQIAIYYADGTRGGSDSPSNWYYVVPETELESEFDFICS